MPDLQEVEISCGIRQLSGLCRESNRYNAADKIPPKTVLLEAFSEGAGGEIWRYNTLPTEIEDITFGIVIFSDSVRRGNGKALAKYITTAKLGEVVASKKLSNPNTHRNIQMWTWYLDRAALIKWFKVNGKDYNHEANPNYGTYEVRWA